MTTCAPLWPTPDASVFQLTEDIDLWKERRARMKAKHINGNGFGTPLAMAVRLDECPCQCHTSMSSAAASPAKTFPTPARAQGSTGHARVFGQSTPVSLANYDPATSSWKTLQLSLLEDSAESLEIWPRSGMTRNGIAYQLQPLAPLTGAIDSGLLPTPTATDHKDGDYPSANARKSPGLGTLATWPTPRTSDTNGPGRHGDGGLDLRTAVAEQATGTGSLNPTWVEWLMGFPGGWTDLEALGTL